MWPNRKFPADLATFTEEILNGKLHLLCRVRNICSEKHAPRDPDLCCGILHLFEVQV